LRVRLADLKGRSVAVWGTDDAARAALTAIAAEQPSRLLAVDDRPTYSSIPWDPSLPPLAGGDHAFPALLAADVVVLTPGVPRDHPWLAEIRSREITITSGPALFLAAAGPETIAVTGSRVATALISHLLAACGRPNVTGGPVLALPPASLYVVELPPADCRDLTDPPRVAVATELSADDQLDLLRSGPEMIVVNGADLTLRDAIRGLTDANRFPPIPAGAEDSRFRVENKTVFCSDEPLFPRSTLPLAGDDSARDLCVALAVLDGLGIDVPGSKTELRAAVAAFAASAERDLAAVDAGEDSEPS
jgi:UDP-N-acetylmuramoyl-L-alanine---L-glutamate ligase